MSVTIPKLEYARKSWEGNAKFVKQLKTVQQLLRGTILNRTYGIDKNLHIYLFLLTIFGPNYYGPPS